MIEALNSNEATRDWLRYLSELGTPPIGIVLPEAAVLPSILRELAVPEEDIGTLVAGMPSPACTPEAWWVLSRAASSLIRYMGMLERPPMFPALPAAIVEEQPFFFVYVFLATLPHVQAYHTSRNVPASISRATLADLGRSLRAYRRAHGVGGFDLAFWLTFHFRGMIYQLGRLQFERGTLGRRTGRAIAETGLPYNTGYPALAIHVPGDMGPLTPDDCDASIAQAVSFFARHFPEERYELAVCNSWLLDAQLADYLPAGSNIIKFQRRFTPAYRPPPDREWILRFIFGWSDVDLDAAPRRTTLERAVVDHLTAGRDWYGGAGWMKLPSETISPETIIPKVRD